MKSLLLSASLLLGLITNAQTFTPRADFPGGKRTKVAAAIIGQSIYVGSGVDSIGNMYRVLNCMVYPNPTNHEFYIMHTTNRNEMSPFAYRYPGRTGHCPLNPASFIRQ